VTTFKTLHINTERSWRGGEQQVLYLATGLRDRGHEATVACQPASPLTQRARDAGLDVAEVPMRGEFDFRAVIRLSKLIRDRRPDIVHMHTSHAHALGCGATTLARRGRTVVSRRVDVPVAANLWSSFKYHHGVDRYIAISQAVRRALIAGGVDEGRISVVHSGIDTTRFDHVSPTGLREAFAVPPEAPIVGSIAALTREKGHRHLLAAVPRVLASQPDARFVLVGDGTLRQALEAQAKSLDIAQAVTFTGFRADVPECLAAFDLFVMPSLREGLCTSVLDALAMRKAVVASATGGLPEIVRHEQTGLLVPPKEPEPLAEAIVRLLHDRDLACRLAEAGRQLVETEFSAQSMVEGTLRAYHEVMHESQDRPDHP